MKRNPREKTKSRLQTCHKTTVKSFKVETSWFEEKLKEIKKEMWYSGRISFEFWTRPYFGEEERHEVSSSEAQKWKKTTGRDAADHTHIFKKLRLRTKGDL